jgi:hypothetical protein
MVGIALHGLIYRPRDLWMRAVKLRVAIHEEGAILAEFWFGPRQLCYQFTI